jgi:hypothetical protein
MKLAKTIVLVVVMGLALASTGCPDEEGGGQQDPLGDTTGDDGGGAPQAIWCAPDANGVFNLVGDLGGLQANARVSIELLPEYAVMAGDIQSANAYYTFTSDIVGTSGYGDMTDGYTGERFRVHFELYAEGFILTSNPLQSPTNYIFTCAQ